MVTPQQQVRVYGLLGELFSAPPSAEIAEAVCQMAAAVGIGCPEGLAQGELEREFMELFRLPNPRYVAPYESVYRDRRVVGTGPDGKPLVVERLLMGPSTEAIRQCFLDAGVLPSEDLPDHIGNELRLMSHLWTSDARPADGSTRSLEQLRAAVRVEHLLQWIGPLREKVMEKERLGFYSAALELVKVVLQNDEPQDLAESPDHVTSGNGG